MTGKKRTPEGTGWRKGRDGKMYAYARVTWMENGRLRSKEKRARNITHARDLRNKMLQELKGHGPELLEAEKLTFAELAARYARDKLVEPVYAGDTKIAGQRAWRKQLGFLKPLVEYFGRRLVRSITYEDLADYRKKRFETPTKRGNQRSVSNLNRELSLLRSIFSYARRANLITRSPFDQGAPLISVADETRRNRILTREEEQRLLDVCVGRRAHLYYLIVVAIETALRKGEILQLLWSDVDFDANILRVRSSTTKTRRPRIIGMTSRLRTALQNWQIIYEEESGLIFRGIKDVKRSFATACRLAGVGDLHFHDLRHTATTRMIQAGIAPMLVAQTTGHSQMRTMMRYINVDEQSARQIATLLDSESQRTNDPGSEPEDGYVN